MKPTLSVALLISLTTLQVNHCETSIKTNCDIAKTRIICNNTIPETVPAEITEVYVYNLGVGSTTFDINGTYFRNESWQNITTLQMYFSNTDTVTIHYQCFKNLKHLLTLGIHSNSNLNFNDSAFEGLTNLITLDFSECTRLQLPDIVTVLKYGNALPNLKNLNFNSKFNVYTRMVLDDDCYAMLANRHIQSVSISQTKLYISTTMKQKPPLDLIYLDLSGSSIADMPLDTDFVQRWLRSLMVLNISGLENVRRSIPAMHLRDTEISLCYLLDVFTAAKNMEIFVANDLFKVNGKLGMDNVTLNARDCMFHVKKVHVRNNDLGHLNATFLFPVNCSLLEVDASNNGITYLSPNIFINAQNLTTLFLNDNNLHMMEQFPEFEDIFQNLPNLEYLTLGSNQLGRIPGTIFRNNIKLKSIYLQNNNFKTINFQLHILVNLEMLDISQNQINCVHDASLESLKSLYAIRTEDGNGTFQLNVTGNPIECTCKCAPFIELLNNMQTHFSYTSDRCVCDLEGEIVHVSENTVKESKYLCKRTIYIVVGSVTAIVGVALIVALIVHVKLRINKRNRNNQILTFLRDMRDQKLDENFLCLLSYANMDSEVVIGSIYGKLDNSIRIGINLDRNVMCTGATHFQAGRLIKDEIRRTTRESCVVVFIVSNGFCESEWCRIEIKEACRQNKPMILLFIEDVPINRMCKELVNSFQRCVRAKLLVNENEEYDIQPGGWEGFVNSIIELASEACYKKFREIQLTKEQHDGKKYN